MIYKGKLFVASVIFIALIASAELSLSSVVKDFKGGLVSGVVKTHVAYYYLAIRKWFAAKDKYSEYALSVAYSVARLPEKDYLSTMENGGHALLLLKPIALDQADENAPWKIQAAYEALLLLVRMPLDAELLSLSDQFAQELNVFLKQSESSADHSEIFQIKELLSMYVARKLGDAKMLEGMLAIPDEHAQWRNDLATVRVVLAACAQRATAVPDLAKEALSRGFGPGWLHREMLSGWDIALSQTVIKSNTSDECKKISRTYQQMINFVVE